MLKIMDLSFHENFGQILSGGLALLLLGLVFVTKAELRNVIGLRLNYPRVNYKEKWEFSSTRIKRNFVERGRSLIAHGLKV